jgi:uncharacterized protein
MTEPAGTVSGLGERPPSVQWAVILAASTLAAALIHLAGLPATFLLGPMLAAIFCGVQGATVRPPAPLFAAAQSVVGVLVAASIEPSVIGFFAADWQLIALAVLATVAASSFLGWLISRLRVMPGSTAVWGSSPGAATAMVLMAEAFGADARLVAFMQYLRVIMVSGAAALIAALFLPPSPAGVAHAAWLPAPDWAGLGATLLAALAGGLLGRALRLPSSFLLGSMASGVALHLGLGLAFQLPPPLLAASYAVVGWRIGLSFTRPVLRHAVRALPQIVASILALMLFCGLTAFVLHRALGLDPLTAYLATSPGGLDSIAIIAAASGGVNISFVLATQTARFLFVLLFGPALAKLVARSVGD